MLFIPTFEQMSVFSSLFYNQLHVVYSETNRVVTTVIYRNMFAILPSCREQHLER